MNGKWWDVNGERWAGAGGVARVLDFGAPSEPVDATHEFNSSVGAAMRHFGNSTNPFRHVKVFSRRTGKWYQNSEEKPNKFNEIK